MPTRSISLEEVSDRIVANIRSAQNKAGGVVIALYNGETFLIKGAKAHINSDGKLTLSSGARTRDLFRAKKSEQSEQTVDQSRSRFLASLKVWAVTASLILLSSYGHELQIGSFSKFAGGIVTGVASAFLYDWYKAATSTTFVNPGSSTGRSIEETVRKVIREELKHGR